MTRSADPKTGSPPSIGYSILPATLVAITVVRSHFAPLCLVILLVAEWFVARVPLALAEIAAAFGMPARLVFAFCAFAALSAAWSPVPLHSLEVAATIFAVCVGTFLVPCLIALSPETRTARLRFGVLAGYTIGAGLIAFEYHAGFPFTKAVVTAFPDWTEPGKGSAFVVKVGDELRAYPGLFSRSMFVLSAFAWPVVHLAWNCTIGLRRIVYLAAPTLFLALTVPFSEKAAALLSLAVSGGIFAIACKWPKAGLTLLLAGWTAVTLLAPVVIVGRFLPEDLRSELPQAVDSRLVIWNRTASAIVKHPLIGIGADATRAAEKARVSKLPKPARQLDWSVKANLLHLARRHPHNSYLQVWYELGATGAALLFAAGFALLLALRRLPPSPQPFAAATFAGVAAYASVAHSLWQPWFAATIALAFILFRLAWLAGR